VIFARSHSCVDDMMPWKDLEGIPALHGPQEGRQRWCDGFRPCTSIAGQLEDWPAVESPTSHVKLLLTDSGLCSLSCRDHLDRMASMLQPPLTAQSNGTLLWIVDAKNSETPQARADWLRSQLDDMKYLSARFPKLKHTRLIMCPLYAWNGDPHIIPTPLKRSVDLENFTNPSNRPMDELQQTEILAESQNYEELNMSDLSTLLATTKIIYGLGGNPWTLKWAFQQPAGQLVLDKINSENGIYVGRSAGSMVMSRWIGRLTGDSKFYSPAGRDVGSIDVSYGSDKGLGILPANCCFRPHCLVSAADGWQNRKAQVANFAVDHPQDDTIVIYTREEDRIDDGGSLASGGDAVAFYGGELHWVDMDQPPSAYTSFKSNQRSCGCEEGCMLS